MKDWKFKASISFLSSLRELHEKQDERKRRKLEKEKERKKREKEKERRKRGEKMFPEKNKIGTDGE